MFSPHFCKNKIQRLVEHTGFTVEDTMPRRGGGGGGALTNTIGHCILRSTTYVTPRALNLKLGKSKTLEP